MYPCVTRTVSSAVPYTKYTIKVRQVATEPLPPPFRGHYSQFLSASTDIHRLWKRWIGFERIFFVNTLHTYPMCCLSDPFWGPTHPLELKNEINCEAFGAAFQEKQPSIVGPLTGTLSIPEEPTVMPLSKGPSALYWFLGRWMYW